MILRARIAAFILFVSLLTAGPALAQTLAVNMLVVLEIFHLFFIRNIYGASLTLAAARGTKVVWMCVISVTMAQFAITYLPPMQRIFGTAAVPMADGVLIVVIGAFFFALIETEKQMRLAFRRVQFRQVQAARAGEASI